MNEELGDGESGNCCSVHQRDGNEEGVCPFCLNERLMVLATKQGRTALNSAFLRRKPSISLPNFFAFGAFLHRLEFRHRKSDGSDFDASTSPADSFISIKIEDNGVASWEKTTTSKVPLPPKQCNMPWSHSSSLSKLPNDKESKSLVEHAKPRASLRWRKRIGQLFQLIRWKRSNKRHVCHVGSKMERVKVRKSWIWSLTKRRVKE